MAAVGAVEAVGLAQIKQTSRAGLCKSGFWCNIGAYLVQLDRGRASMGSCKKGIAKTAVLALLAVAVEMMFLPSFAFAVDSAQKTWVLDKPRVIEDLNALDNNAGQAFVQNNMTFVPARALADQFEIGIDYRTDSQEMVLTSHAAELRFLLNKGSALILDDQGAETMNVMSYCLEGVSYIPLRFAAEKLHLNVAYKAPTGEIEVSGAVNQKDEKFQYVVDEDTLRIIDAVNGYNQAAVVELISSQEPPQRVMLKRDGLNTTMDIWQDERIYQVVIHQQWQASTGMLQTAQGISEIRDGQSIPMRLLGGEAFFSIGNLGISEYECYSISKLTKESLANGGCLYTIRKIGDVETHLSLFVDDAGQICRYIIYGEDDGVSSDYTVKIVK